MADPQAMVDEVIAKENAMMTPVDTVRNSYAAIAAGDTGKMVSLMTPDIEWISLVDFNIKDRGPEEVMKKVLVPLMQEWERASHQILRNFLLTARRWCHWAASLAYTAPRTNVPTLHTRTYGISRTGKSNATVSTSILWRLNKLDAPSAAGAIFIAQHASLTGYFRQEVVTKGTS